MNLKCENISKSIDKVNYILIFKDNRLLVNSQNNSFSLLTSKDINVLKISLKNCYIVDSYQEADYYLAELDDDINLPQSYLYQEVRSMVDYVDENIFWIIGHASHLNHWHKENKYCGRCGKVTIRNFNEASIKCTNCNTVTYPRINPAIIVAITKGDKILLAKNVNFKSDFYSVLAGYVEPGETLEQCVKREVKEEVNIEIKNIKYFGSQPWPFPNSLMIGFIAEYKSGDIDVKLNELSTANWFGVNDLPEIPTPISISRRLIDWFIQNNA